MHSFTAQKPELPWAPDEHVILEKHGLSIACQSGAPSGLTNPVSSSCMLWGSSVPWKLQNACRQPEQETLRLTAYRQQAEANGAATPWLTHRWSSGSKRLPMRQTSQLVGMKPSDLVVEMQAPAHALQARCLVTVCASAWMEEPGSDQMANPSKSSLHSQLSQPNALGCKLIS